MDKRFFHRVLLLNVCLETRSEIMRRCLRIVAKVSDCTKKPRLTSLAKDQTTF
jgi:hypothetical protein